MSEIGEGAGLYDKTGNRISSGGQTEQDTEALVRFAKEQPLATALGAIILGYFIGKMF